MGSNLCTDRGDAPIRPSCTSLSITCIRTSCFLLQLRDIVIVTDPWFSHFMFCLPSLRAAGRSLTSMPAAGVALCSHFHPDHFDFRAIKWILRKRGILLCPPLPFFLRRKVRKHVLVIEAFPGQKLCVGKFEFSVFRGLHTFPPPHENIYVIKGNNWTILFAGDVRYSGLFRVLSSVFDVDIAFLPVSGTIVWGRQTVMGPAAAAQAAVDVMSKLAIPMHQGGDWMSLPPISFHPGTLVDFETELRRMPANIRPNTALLYPGDTLQAVKNPINGSIRTQLLMTRNRQAGT